MTYASELEQFEAGYEIDPSTGCWEWQKCKTLGYGRLAVAGTGKKSRAHRQSHALHTGPIPDGMLVCHACDNPSCVNPDHLFLGTQSDNMADMTAKGRQSRGEASGSAKLTKSDVLEIRDLALHKVFTQAAIGALYDIDQTAVSKIHSRKSWRHI